MRLPLRGQQIEVTHMQVTTVTDEYGDTTTTETINPIPGCLHAPEHPSETDQRVVVPATLLLPGSHVVGDTDYFVYPDGARWEVIGGGADWGKGTAVQVKRWGRRGSDG